MKLNELIHAISRRYPDSKFHGANMGPTGVLAVPDGPHVGPMNFAIRINYLEKLSRYNRSTSLRSTSLQDISNHQQQLHCLFHNMFRLTTMKTPKPHVNKLLWGESIGDRCFPSQWVSNAQVVSKSDVMISCASFSFTARTGYTNTSRLDEMF